jgi:hypothetical protein
LDTYHGCMQPQKNLSFNHGTSVGAGAQNLGSLWSKALSDYQAGRSMLVRS